MQKGNCGFNLTALRHSPPRATVERLHLVFCFTEPELEPQLRMS
jgi:hypothetical protein